MLNYSWKKSEYPEKNGFKVMSTFACGGGSTMGYKLAGFDVVAANDIDKQMAEVYKKNHNPKHYYLEDIRELVKREDLPEELFNLDILDGSPPCSVFSVTGNREKDWGKEKQFREGQALQTLDDLFYHFIQLAKKLQPKVVVAENVKGMLVGNAKGYVKEIFREFDRAGYEVQLFLLNSATMGVPQRRERVFFICRRKDLKLPKIELHFNGRPIPFSEVSDESDRSGKITELEKHYWFNAKQGQSVGKFSTVRKIALHKPANTVVSNSKKFHPIYPRKLNETELKAIGSFPTDFDFCGFDVNYIIGMSVPPLMTGNIAENIRDQWLKTI